MIRVQLYRRSRAVLDELTSSDAAANALIDATIDAVHHGRHGEGCFRLNADRVTPDGLFMGVFWSSPVFHHPVPISA